jgi:hypothetical protein
VQFAGEPHGKCAMQRHMVVFIEDHDLAGPRLLDDRRERIDRHGRRDPSDFIRTSWPGKRSRREAS